MSRVSALGKLLKANDIYDQMKEAEKLNDYVKKLNKKEPGKTYGDAFKYFGNDKIDRVTATLRKTNDAAGAVLSAKMQWPRSGTVPSYSFALKAAHKYGHDSKQAKAAVRKYKERLNSYDKKLMVEVLKIAPALVRIPKMSRQAEAMKTYASALHDSFAAFGKFPNITTAIPAQFMVWSEDCSQLSSVAGSVHSKFQKIEKRNKELVKEGKDLLATNRLWIKWAINDATSSADSLKKNQKAAKPKR